MPKRRCLHRGCPELITRGSYCAQHKPYGPGWPVTSRLILERDHFNCKCQGCGQCDSHPQYQKRGIHCNRYADTVDHINGAATDTRPGNLRAMCRPCNTAKGGL